MKSKTTIYRYIADAQPQSVKKNSPTVRRFFMLVVLMMLVVLVKAQDKTTHEDGVYKIYWKSDKRGYLTYHTDYPSQPQLAGVELGNYGILHYSLDAAGIQLSWYLYTSNKTNKSYLFEATTGKFITINPTIPAEGGWRCELSENVSQYAQFDKSP